MTQKVAVVTGANKGLGFAIVKGLCRKFDGKVYLTSPNEALGLEAVRKLNEIGLEPEYHQLDVTKTNSVKDLADFIKTKHGGFDVLVNNSGILVDWQKVYPIYDAAKRNIETNYRSLLTIENYMFPLLKDGGRVVNMSGACGHLSNIKNAHWLKILKNPDLTVAQVDQFVDQYLESVRNGTFDKNDFADEAKHAEHRVSKIALTALTKIEQRKYSHLSINAVHPGHIMTDVANHGGEFEADEAAKVVLYLILVASPKLKGAYMWHNGRIIDWLDSDAEFCRCPW